MRFCHLNSLGALSLEEGLYSSFVVFVRDFGNVLVLFCVFMAC